MFVPSFSFIINIDNRRSVKNWKKSNHLLFPPLRGFTTVKKVCTCSHANWTNRMCSYVDFFTFRKRTISSYTNEETEGKDRSEDHTDEDSDKLFLNENSEEEGNEVELVLEVEDKGTINNIEPGSTNGGTLNAPVKTRKKSKYDSDVVIIYDDTEDFPGGMFTSHLSEEEIDQVNSGGSGFACDDYSSKIIYDMKKKK
ncbi:conserved Plasmodium protein, unknown function [Plasmodium ovale]|uniref:Uncharacterized protein n=2 Tax=Plasmodium ovale TaxID=36330 RepID=A0A1C3KXN9_PLAOA|nr:conserved Plasmodium protein, unknown function [Plasmodium ovale]